MKKMLFIIVGFYGLNSFAVNPTQGPLQQDPSLCAYGYNPNCQPQHSRQAKKVIEHIHINVPSKYGAIASNSKTGVGGGSINMNSLKDAKKEAIRVCEDNGKNAPCKVVAWVRNGCIATAKGLVGKNGKLFKAVAKQPGQVEQLVLNQCISSGASGCKIYAPEGCSIPDGMYN